MRLRLQTMLTLLDLPLEEIPCEYHDAMQALWGALDALPKRTMEVYGLVMGIRRRRRGYELCSPHSILVVADRLKSSENQVCFQVTKARRVLQDAILDARVLDAARQFRGERPPVHFQTRRIQCGGEEGR